MSYYDILGVRVDASVDEIQQAYRALARKVHPDLNGQDGGRAEARMKQLNEIRDTLTDPLLRSAYDAELAKSAGARADESARPAPDDGHRAPPPADVPRAPRSPRGRRWFFSFRGLARTTAAVRLALALLSVVGVVLVIDELLAQSPWGGTPLRRTLHSAFDRLTSELLPAPADSSGATRTPVPSSSPKSTPGPAQASAPSPKPGSARKGVVKVGSTAAEVIRLLGAPDRTEPGSRPGNVFMVYGALRFELRHGVVIGGGM